MANSLDSMQKIACYSQSCILGSTFSIGVIFACILIEHESNICLAR
jgi:hypothetical protein